jgi:hypothetical protein
MTLNNLLFYYCKLDFCILYFLCYKRKFVTSHTQFENPKQSSRDWTPPCPSLNRPALPTNGVDAYSAYLLVLPLNEVDNRFRISSDLLLPYHVSPASRRHAA